MRPKGTIVQVGLMGGGSATVNVGLLLSKRVCWIGTVLRARPLEEKLAISRRFAAEVLPLFASGALRPVIDRRFPLDDVAEAHRADGGRRQRRQDPARRALSTPRAPSRPFHVVVPRTRCQPARTTMTTSTTTASG